MLNELVKPSAQSNNHIMKSQPPTSIAFAFSRATAITLEYPTLTPNLSNAPFVAAAITPSTPHPINVSTPTYVAQNSMTKLYHHSPNSKAIS
jgi:hypothetical protein